MIHQVEACNLLVFEDCQVWLEHSIYFNVVLCSAEGASERQG